MSRKRPNMVIAVNVIRGMMTLCKGQVAFFRKHGFDVDVLAYNDDPNGVESVIKEGAEFFEMDFVRDLSPFADLKTIWCLFKLFRSRKPKIVQLMTLKPSILGAIAGRLTGVPVIVRHKWGNIRECNYRGFKRFLLFSAHRLSDIMAHRVVVICHRLAEAEIQSGAVDHKKVIVYGSGSSNGLDLNRFKLTPERRKKGRQIREQLQIDDDCKVIGTVMRVNIEKGIRELVEAFCKLAENIPNLHLIIIGGYDIRNLPPEETQHTIEEHPQIHFVGFVKNIEDYYAAMNVFVTPSYREGFCKSNIEASGMELPVVATDIIGCSESVISGVTGLLVPLRDSNALAEAIEKILVDQELAKRLGRSGRERVEREFDQKLVWHNQLGDFCSLMKEKNIKPPIEPGQIVGKTCPLCNK